MSKRFTLLIATCAFLVGMIMFFTACTYKADEAYIPFTEASGASTAATSAKTAETTSTTTTATTATETTETTLETTESTTETTEETTTAAPKSADAPGVYKPDRKAAHYIVVHIGSQSVAVYGKDSEGKYNQLVQCFTCSTGTEGHDTPTGSFKITKRYDWRALVGNVYGQYSCRFASSYLFHSVPYKKQKASTLDNAEYDKLGTPASHGCVRLCVRDCKWIYDNCENGTQVYITKDAGPAGNGVPARNKDKAYNGWDPTDKWSKGNPYFAVSEKTEAAPTETAPTETVPTEAPAVPASNTDS